MSFNERLTQSMYVRNPETAINLQLAPASREDIQFVTDQRGRQVVLICSNLQKNQQEIINLLAKINKTDRTVARLWFLTQTNPEYVDQVNLALDKIGSVLNQDQLSSIDERAKQLFLSRALQGTDLIMKANEINEITDFNNRRLNALQDKLIRAGASLDYIKVINFIEQIAPVAFLDEGPCFRYPSFNEWNKTQELDPNGILMCEGGYWKLVKVENQPDQMEVLKNLRDIVEALKSTDPQGVVSKLSVEELLYGLVLIGQVMTNYLTQIDQTPRVSNQVFEQLYELHRLISGHLDLRNANGWNIHLNRGALDDFKDTFGILQNVLRNPKFANFYCKDAKIEMLKAADSILKPFITFHITPHLLLQKHKWTVICENKKNGVNVYKNPKNELVIIFNGHNTFWERKAFNAFSFLGGRGNTFGNLDGLVHQQSLEEAMKARDALMQILNARSDLIKECSKVRFVGYGLDGSIAQLIGFDYKSDNPKKDVMVIGCGVPPFLDETAAASMGNAMQNMAGFQCVNYSMAGDPNMKNMGCARVLGMPYDNTAFTTVPVPQGVIFTSEAATGDYRKAYMQMLTLANMMHFSMRDVFVHADTYYNLLDKVDPVNPPLVEEVKEPHKAIEDEHKDD